MTADNTRLVRDYLEIVWNQGRTSQAATLVAEDLVQHNRTLPDGRQALVDHVDAARQAMPDLRFDVKRTIAQDDLVVAHSSFTAAGGAVALVVIDIYRVENGRIAEHWDAAEQVPDSPVGGRSVF
ncbi:ester cyclase [Lentzea sp. NPDC060358]|uniref:nuclear transport factor 2 family protein n=1 Tax=Lentzea sp. NPDC060358 TaxID=3347103 RepID=UPI0036496A58